MGSARFMVFIFLGLLLAGNLYAKGLFFAEVAPKVSEAFCGKMEECSPVKIPRGQCIEQMKSALLESHKALPKDKKIELTPEELAQCLKTIQESKCDQLRAAQRLEGCEFIETLSR